MTVMAERRSAALAESYALRVPDPEIVLPFATLGDWIRARCGREPSVRNVQVLCRVSKRRAARWCQTGVLSMDEADAAAIRLGTHPSAIWVEWTVAA